MNSATALALIAVTFNVSVALILAVMATAPGWRRMWAFSAIVFTAALANINSVMATLPWLAASTHVWAARTCYFAGHLNAIIWFCFAFGGPDASCRQMPRGVRIASAISLTVATVLFVTGGVVYPTVEVMAASWTGASYVLPHCRPLGTLISVVIGLHFAVALVQLVSRWRRGDRGNRLQLVAFAVFMCGAGVLVLTANRVINLIALGDIGMALAVVVIAVDAMRHFVNDARDLNRLKGTLEGQVREQTAWRDRAQVAFAESERMASIGRMAAGVCHEINNPLTYLLLSLGDVEEHLVTSRVPPHVLASFEHVRDGAVRIQKVAERLRSASRSSDTHTPLDLREVVDVAIRMAGLDLLPDVHVNRVTEPVRPILGDEPRLVQAVSNLLANAAQAVKQRSGARSIDIQISEGSGHEVVLVIRDDGIGMRAESLNRLGEPYFTTWSHAGGLGLGLFTTQKIVNANRGRMSVASAPDAGTIVTLVFPATDKVLAPHRQPGSPKPVKATVAGKVLPGRVPDTPGAAPVLQKKPSVLVIDDEPLILKLLGSILQKAWDVTTALNGADALARLDSGRFDAVVCDLMMPGMSGIDVAREVERKYPDIRPRMLFLTGGAVTIDAEDFLARPDVRHMTKPVTRTELHAALTDVAGLSWQ